MARDNLSDLPIDVLGKIVGLLPVLDRSRLEVACKTLLGVSQNEVTTIDFTFKTLKEAEGVPGWLLRIGAMVQRLRLLAPRDGQVQVRACHTEGNVQVMPLHCQDESSIYDKLSKLHKLPGSLYCDCHLWALHGKLEGWWWEVKPCQLMNIATIGDITLIASAGLPQIGSSNQVLLGFTCLLRIALWMCIRWCKRVHRRTLCHAGSHEGFGLDTNESACSSDFMGWEYWQFNSAVHSKFKTTFSLEQAGASGRSLSLPCPTHMHTGCSLHITRWFSVTSGLDSWAVIDQDHGLTVVSFPNLEILSVILATSIILMQIDKLKRGRLGTSFMHASCHIFSQY